MGKARELAEEYFGALSAGNVERAMDLFSGDADFVSPAGRMRGPDQIRPFLTVFATAFPEARFSIDHVVESGATASVEGRYTGTQAGPLATPDGGAIPATGKAVDIPYVTLIEIQGERITAHRAYWDQLAFMTQLGLGPPPRS
ncbi:MAG TPA: nuclear transport factor 2 family protein [Chloroflexota bacterium]|jgi:steroid delta-isomerase-like uncharacterized protein